MSANSIVQIFPFDLNNQDRVKDIHLNNKKNNSNAILLMLLLTTVLNFQSGWCQKLWHGSVDDNWSNASNWIPSGVPSSSDDVILNNTHVLGSYTVTLDGATVRSCKSLTIGYNGNINTITLLVNGSVTNLLTVGGAFLSNVLIIDQGGVLNNSWTGTGTRGILLNNSGNIFQMKNNGKYIHNTTNSKPIPELTSGTTNLNYSFALASVFELQRWQQDIIPIYGNFVYNIIGGTNSLTVSPLNITGDLKVLQGIFGAGSGSSNTVNISGNLEISGNAEFRGSSGSGTQTINITGNVTGEGTFSGSTSGGTTTNINVGGSITSKIGFNLQSTAVTFSGGISGVSFAPSNSSIPTVKNIIIASGKFVNLGANIAVSASSSLTIDSGGQLNCNSSIISGPSASLIVNGTLGVGSLNTSGAISGNVTVGTLILNVTSTVEFNGTSAQKLAARTFSNLLINNSNGVSVIGDVTINGDLTITTGSRLTVDSGKNLTVNKIINNSGANGFVLENNANLLQSDAAINSETTFITVKRKSSAMNRYDYTLWSSPVTGQNLRNFSPITPTHRFYLYNTAGNTYANVFPSNDILTYNFVPATGMMIMFDEITPSATIFEGVFKGVPNNGNQTFAMSTAENGYNAVGNPYPSSINIANFITENSTNIEGTLWFWRTTGIGGPSSSYVTCTGAGCDSGSFNGKISTGQGFFVKAINSVDLSFTNAMRVAATGPFFRTNNETSRVWLNLGNGNGAVLGQKMIAYTSMATVGYDNGLDGLYMNDSPVALYSKADGRDVVINARPGFTVDDVVPLIFKTSTAGNYTVSLSQFDGLFVGDQPVYLRDNATGIVHNLKTSAYSFVTDSGIFANRFDILYQNALSVNVPVFNANQVVVYKVNNELVINTGNNEMTNVKVFDLSGRLMAVKKDVNAAETVLFVGVSESLLLLQIESKDGVVVTKKVI